MSVGNVLDKELADVAEPPQVIAVRRIKGEVTWVRVVRVIGGKVTVHIESRLNPGDPICIDTSWRPRSRLASSVATAGLVGGMAALIASIVGPGTASSIEWIATLAAISTLVHIGFNLYRRSTREKKVKRSGCDAEPGPMLRLIVEEVVRDAARAEKTPSKKWIATIAGLPYEASAYRGKLGYMVGYKRLSRVAVPVLSLEYGSD